MTTDLTSTDTDGSPTKLHIDAYSDPEFSDDAGSFTVQINPEKYTQTFKINYDTQAASGASHAPAKFSRIMPIDLHFELLFDATGVVDATTDVDDKIESFKSVVYAYDGEIHEPHYLRLFWGTLQFGARLTSLSITYTLFSPTGEPLRARADANFFGYEDATTSALKADRRSPDITRQVVTVAGDSLPLLTERYYGDPRYVREVARHNGLINYRRLPAGLTLQFPPLD